MNITVRWKAGSTVLPAQPGQTLLDVLQDHGGLPIHAPCGGQGTCQKCMVYLSGPQGETPVLACRTKAADGMVLRLPSAAPLAVETRSGDSVAAIPDTGLSGYGVACDIGTTTVVCHLVDLTTGRLLATIGEGNAQRSYGGDVIARIKASIEGKRPALTAAIVDQLSRMLRELCDSAGIPVEAVQRMAVAANTTMCHLLAGLPPDGMGAAPFTPASLFGECYEA